MLFVKYVLKDIVILLTLLFLLVVFDILPQTSEHINRDYKEHGLD
jgi:hypothetical protein